MQPWPQTWAAAWDRALYGPDGFFLRERPLDHFRTSVAVPLFATAVRRLAATVDDLLGHPDPFDVVDLGAGRGELLDALPDVPSRWRLLPVDVGLGTSMPGSVHGLLLAHEWLDSVPCDVLEGDRLVLVDDLGEESLGPLAGADLLAWRDRWWPDAEGPGPDGAARTPGAARVEVGLTRDLAWASVVARVTRGVAVAVDYDHDLRDRRPTLTGYRRGRQVPPVPDGSCDLTAHVALDACAAATGGSVVRQADALRALGVSAARPAAGASDYLRELERAGQAATLLDPAGLGGFGWLVTPVEAEDPLATCRRRR